ncbi:MAG: Dolichyl-phosphate-mannose-protein mannosyltransferase [Frankiales bacterium]|nr:Dolichyl-phosphate-mannose-protein mannosyltransferase [Frankiales bacterium]
MLMLLGLALRLVLALKMPGNPFDTRSFQLVAQRLTEPQPLHLYGDINDGATFLRWPYPPGFFPVLLALQHLFGDGHAFAVAMRLPAIAADLAIALLLYVAVAKRRGETQGLACAALVLLGPSFAAISGAHGQLDALAILPALAAVIVWQDDWTRRALVAGALIGVGACIKTVPAFFLLALLPTVRSRKEGVQLVAAAAALPVLALAPFFLAEPRGVVHALQYRGLPGLGGVSMLAQPSLAKGWLSHSSVRLSSLSDLLQHRGTVLVLVAVVVTGLLLRRRRMEAPAAAVAIALALLAFGLNFSLGYVLWLLPFLLLAGWMRSAFWIQLALLGPTVMIYGLHWVRDYGDLAIYGFYVPVMTALLLAAVVAHARLLRAPA